MEIKSNLNIQFIAHRNPEPHKDIVICRLPDNTTTPFVTYRYDPATCEVWSGNYFSQLIYAVEDFRTR